MSQAEMEAGIPTVAIGTVGGAIAAVMLLAGAVVIASEVAGWWRCHGRPWLVAEMRFRREARRLRRKAWLASQVRGDLARADDETRSV